MSNDEALTKEQLDCLCEMLNIGAGNAAKELTRILGSCVVVTLYDARRRMGGLADIILPETISLNGNRHGPYHCAEPAITHLLGELQAMGVERRDLVAKMVGGARMFRGVNELLLSVGEQNIRSILQLLNSERITLVGEDVGGHIGRSVEFYLETGSLIVKVIRKEQREI